ncbi:hypothetical protein CNBG_9317 [Cryptococcus deuterogattii R265]|uniref:Zn(2)-C6 fungal-type domain-containing protein n=1 Tax=Cryptococcus deuterogattii (strain R265) TaxID=294750 RepID=A0A0L6DH45_CRYD2|nr:hypothetical protein I310_01518 [Cryptococcus deuterogattii CA1014]KNX50005.1 hypothetical protein CNBG_9317 [Cryptococcus deuterogattii R265]
MTSSPRDGRPSPSPDPRNTSREGREHSVSSDVSNGTKNSPKRKRNEDSSPKALQACDRCRTKKIKCHPAESSSFCRSCTIASLSCTYDLPITASRTKRIQRGLSTHPQTTQQLSSIPSGQTDARPSNPAEHFTFDLETTARYGRVETYRDRDMEASEKRETESTFTTGLVLRQEGCTVGLTQGRASPSVRREGPTALSYILHSTPTLPIANLSEFDHANGFSMRFSPSDPSVDGDGFILVTTETTTSSTVYGQAVEPPPYVFEALHSPSWKEVVNRLAMTFIDHISPFMPVVVRGEMDEVGQLALYAMAGVAAARRDCPREIFDCLRYIIMQEIHDRDVLSNPTRQNVQILLITCLVDELAFNSGTAPPPSVQRTRLSAAICMARDLNMDQPARGTVVGESDARIWQCAAIIDQWNTARYGVRPLVHKFSSSLATPSTDLIDNKFFQHLYSLSTVLRRIIDRVYGVEGLKNTKDEDLLQIAEEVLRWKSDLPRDLQFTGESSSLPSGILHILHTAVMILLYRPFMRWSFIVPQYLSFDLNLEVWTLVCPAARSSLEWAANLRDPSELLFFGPYALGLSCLIQYHSYARRREWDGVVVLERLLTNGIEKWAPRWAHLPLQAAQLSIVQLLYSSTQRILPSSFHHSNTSTRGLNPTPGIFNRLSETAVNGITFLKDPSHPKGGVLVATRQAAREVRDLPPGTVIIGGPLSPEEVDGNVVVSGRTQTRPVGGKEHGMSLSNEGEAVVPTDDGRGTARMMPLASIPGLSALPNSESANVLNSFARLAGSRFADHYMSDPSIDGAIASTSTADWEAIVSSMTYPGF